MSVGACCALKLQIWSGQHGYVLHRCFEVGFILPWELSPSMKGTSYEPSGLWQPGTPNCNGCAGEGQAAESSEQLILLLRPFSPHCHCFGCAQVYTWSGKQYRSSPQPLFIFVWPSKPPSPSFIFVASQVYKASHPDLLYKQEKKHRSGSSMLQCDLTVPV